jgi:hypothetical protein
MKSSFPDGDRRRPINSPWETTLYILMTEDYSPRDKEGGFPPPKEKPPVKMIMM